MGTGTDMREWSRMSLSNLHRHEIPTVRVGGIVLGLVFLLVACRSFGTSRIGGTYIAHGAGYASMLQLTEGKDGQITGTLTEIDLKPDGRVGSETEAIKGGTLDGDQLTLSLSGVFGLFGSNLTGTLAGSGVRIQAVGSDGSVLSWEYERSSPEDLKAYADQLKSRGDAIALNAKFLKTAQELNETTRSAEGWISNAELHDQRIPGAKDYYRKIGDKMQSLVLLERRTPDAVRRGQISVAVNQEDVAGTQLDLQVNDLWDRTIGDSGRNLSSVFSRYPSDCGNPAQLAKGGITQRNSEIWMAACQQILAERPKFERTYEKIMADRSDLKSFQVAEQAHRREFVEQASRLE